jgi:hypothetical protein
MASKAYRSIQHPKKIVGMSFDKEELKAIWWWVKWILFLAPGTSSP